MLLAVLMFAVQSYGIIDTVEVFDVGNAGAPLPGITIKATDNGVFKSQVVTTVKGCVLNILSPKIGDTIRIDPISPLFTFNPTGYKTIVTTATKSILIKFLATRITTSIAPSILNISKSNTGSITHYDLQGKVVKPINKNQGTYIQAVKGIYIKEVKVH
jgi:hypothetical protein